MKRRVFLLVSFAALVCIALFAEREIKSIVTGTATVDGYGGKNSVTVDLKLVDGKIHELKAAGPKETQGVGSIAIERLPEEIVKANSINVDGISGATFTSNAVILATEQALKNAGVNPEDYKKKITAAKEPDENFDTDIVIVGAGGAGMVAAITAADLGKNVIVLEKQSIVGGNSARATGGMNAAHTPEQNQNSFTENNGVEKILKTASEKWQENEIIKKLAEKVRTQFEEYNAKPESERGYFDSVELMELDTLIGGHGVNNPVLVETLAKNSAPAVEWLKSIGIDLQSVGAFGGASVKRIHRPLNADKKVIPVGTYIIPALEKACEARKNIKILTETTATSILTDDTGKVTGVLAQGKHGNKITVKAKSVILAAGGFGANLKMVAKFNPALAGFMTTNAPSITGDGILMGQEVGAAVVDMEQIQIHPTVQFDTAALITEGLRGDGAILVNKEGKRFIDETGTRDVVSAAEIAQTGSFSYLIIDQNMADKSLVIKGYISKGYTKQGDTFGELANVLEIPAEDFATTMKNWNEYVKNRNDPEFSRTSFALPLDKSPFYAIKVTAGIHHTMGGLKIDEQARVLKADDAIIHGLFAAGEITGGVHGGNRLGGNAVADFVIFGRIAGESAAKF